MTDLDSLASDYAQVTSRAKQILYSSTHKAEVIKLQMDKVGAELDETRIKSQQLETEIAEQVQAYELSKAECAALQEKTRQAKAIVADLDNKMNQIQDQIRQLEAALQAVGEQHQASVAAMDHAQDQERAKQDVSVRLDEKISELKTSHAQLKEGECRLNNEYNAFSEDFKDANDHIAKVKAIVASHTVTAAATTACPSGENEADNRQTPQSLKSAPRESNCSPPCKKQIRLSAPECDAADCTENNDDDDDDDDEPPPKLRKVVLASSSSSGEEVPPDTISPPPLMQRKTLVTTSTSSSVEVSPHEVADVTVDVVMQEEESGDSPTCSEPSVDAPVAATQEEEAAQAPMDVLPLEPIENTSPDSQVSSTPPGSPVLSLVVSMTGRNDGEDDMLNMPLDCTDVEEDESSNEEDDDDDSVPDREALSSSALDCIEETLKGSMTPMGGSHVPPLDPGSVSTLGSDPATAPATAPAPVPDTAPVTDSDPPFAPRVTKSKHAPGPSTIASPSPKRVRKTRAKPKREPKREPVRHTPPSTPSPFLSGVAAQKKGDHTRLEARVQTQQIDGWSGTWSGKIKATEEDRLMFNLLVAQHSSLQPIGTGVVDAVSDRFLSLTRYKKTPKPVPICYFCDASILSRPDASTTYHSRGVYKDKAGALVQCETHYYHPVCALLLSVNRPGLTRIVTTTDGKTTRKVTMHACLCDKSQ